MASSMVNPNPSNATGSQTKDFFLSQLSSAYAGRPVGYTLHPAVGGSHRDLLNVREYLLPYLGTAL